MSKKWEGIRRILGRSRNNKNNIGAMRQDPTSRLTFDPKNISKILNKHFATCGQRLAAKMPHSKKHYSDYLQHTNSLNYTSQLD